MIDQEGGRVNRFKNFFNLNHQTSQFFGELYNEDPKKFNDYYYKFISKTSYLLKLTGININTVPVLDLNVKGSSNIIGDRSFSNNPKIVSKIGDICVSRFHQNNIGTVIKHIPGHGLAKVDSHKLTPTIKTKLKQLLQKDFSTFKKKKSMLAMTAHIIYEDIDKSNTATHSSTVIKLIRDNIGFKNILISDDISMKALKHSIKENTLMAFKAGCDLILHCNANLKEMFVVAENSPLISKFIIKKTSQLYKILS